MTLHRDKASESDSESRLYCKIQIILCPSNEGTIVWEKKDEVRDKGRARVREMMCRIHQRNQRN